MSDYEREEMMLIILKGFVAYVMVFMKELAVTEEDSLFVTNDGDSEDSSAGKLSL